MARYTPCSCNIGLSCRPSSLNVRMGFGVFESLSSVFYMHSFYQQKMLPWLKKGLLLLEEDKRYPKTMEKCQKVFKAGNVGVV